MLHYTKACCLKKVVWGERTFEKGRGKKGRPRLMASVAMLTKVR